MTSPRIVVTGARDGKSVVISDGEATTFGIPLMPGSDYTPVWAADEVQRDIPGLLDVFEADNPGMHTSDTVDVDFVLSGEVDVELDDGAEVHLKAGDVLLQHGTRHAWRNKSAEPCVLVVAVTGARRA